MIRKKHLFVTDLDGTLLNTRKAVSPADHSTLSALPDDVLKVVATGRNLYSALKVIPSGLPIDCLVFSSGISAVHWPLIRHEAPELTHSHEIHERDVRAAIGFCKSEGVDFFIQHGLPENHRFHHFKLTRRKNPDFEERIRIYREFAQPGKVNGDWSGPASQLILVLPPDRPCAFAHWVESLSAFNVVRTTSPLDHRSQWIELLPKGASKANACETLRMEAEIDPSRTYAVGNDYNDVQLLEWAAHPAVVGNAPRDLMPRLSRLPSNDQDPISAAAKLWHLI